MNAKEEFARILRAVAPLSDGEKSEALLGYFASTLRDIDTPALIQFRDYCTAWSEGTDAETAMLEIIEGQLALRAIAAAR